MAEVEKLMKDPAFLEEMEKLKSNPMMAKAMENAQEIMNDPEKLGQFYKDMESGMKALADSMGGAGGREGGTDSPSDAQMGLSGLAQAASNPELLAETLKMLDDPEVQSEVQKMMQDPAFQQEMQNMMNAPEYHDAMKKAAEQMEKLAEDPAELAELQEQARNILSGAKAI